MQITGAAENGAAPVAVIGGVAGSAAAAFVTRLRNFLIDDAVEVLLGVEVIVTVEDDVDVIGEEQRVNRHEPAGTVLLETIAAVSVPAHSQMTLPCMSTSTTASIWPPSVEAFFGSAPAATAWS
jgi:hypothetical protein